MKFSHPPGARYLAPFIIVLFLIVKNSAFGQPSLIDCHTKYVVTAHGSHNLHKTLYGQYSNPGHDDCQFSDAFKSCNSHFMFTEYVGATDTFYVELPGTGALPDSNFQWTFTLPNDTTYLMTGSMDGQEFRFDEPGVYHFVIQTNLPETRSDFIANDFDFYIIAIPQVKNVWVEAGPVCDNWTPPLADSQYHFKIRTEPDITDMMFWTEEFASGCATVPGIDIKLDIAASNPVLSSGSFYSILGSASFNSSGIYNEYKNAHWDTPYWGYDLYDFILPTIGSGSYGGFNDFLSGGAHAGQPLYITVKYTDRVAYIDSAPLTVNAPVIIEASALPAAGPVSATAPSFFPPQATGEPVPSYNFYDYTVSGTEHWTPTNNPVTLMNGDGGAVGVIRIQHNLNIPGGKSLYIQNGMTIEMGPLATITVQGNSSSSYPGGYLAVDDSKLTAYRGCGDTDGTDHSTWGGLIVNGNPAWWQGATAYPSLISPQGFAILSHATISYADIGIQNGANPSSTGGIIYGYPGTKFYNNKVSIAAWPYHNIISGLEYNNMDFFNSCAFINDDNEWFSVSNVAGSSDIKKLGFVNCIFTNSTGSPIPNCITSWDAGGVASSCTFNNYTNAITGYSSTATQTMIVDHCTFNNNQFGVYVNGGIGPKVNNNTFNIPAYTGAGGAYLPGTSGVLVLNDQNAGTVMSATTGYNISFNTFQTDATTPPTAYGYYDYTTGTLAYNGGSDNNQVTNNTYTGVGTANLSNFVNNGVTTGLQYLCNTDTHVGYDICAIGHISGSGGINPVQGTSTSGAAAPDRPAGNSFSTHWNVYNMQQPLTYLWYDDATPANPQKPVIYTPATVYTVSYTSGAICYDLSGGGVFSTYALSANNSNNDRALNYAVASSNVRHYMTDSTGIQHRDSLYYWADQMGTAYGDLLITNLLIEDSLIDSANTVYDAIINKYNLTGAEANDFAQGRYLEDVIIYKRVNNQSRFYLSGDQVTSLQSVKANTTMWAHARAENWLFVTQAEAFNDTLLYPSPHDTAQTEVEGKHANTNPGRGGTLQGVAKLKDQVYPNPVHDALQVIYTPKTDEDVAVQIQDISGKVILTQSLRPGVQNTIDMSKLASGMYLYRILEGKKVTMTGKVAKE